MNRATAKFLTLFTMPVLFSCSDESPDCYQDISFINSYNQIDITIREQLYKNGVLESTVDNDMGLIDKGLIRVQLEANCAYDRVDVSIIANIAPLSSFQNTGSGTAWTLGSSPSVTLGGTDLSSYLYWVFPTTAGEQYTIDYTANFGANGANMSIYFLDGNFNEINVVGSPESGVGVNSGQVNITPSAGGTYIAVRILNGGIVNTFTLTALTGESDISEQKTFIVDCGCSNQEMRLTWLNYLGGMEHWDFTAEKEKQIDIIDTQETRQNIFPNWPKSYGETANTIRKQTMRESNERWIVRSQNVSRDNLEVIKYIRTSPLVQIINSRTDTRTVIVDNQAFTVYDEGDKTFNIEFVIEFTDNIPSQTV